MQLKLLFEQANNIEFFCDAEKTTARKATAEERLEFIAKGLEQLINTTKEFTK